MNAEIDIRKTVLKTERLILRAWKEEDVCDLYEYARVDGVGQMAGWLPHKSIEDSLEILKMFIEEKKTFALEYQGKVIGSLGIERYNEEKLPEFAGLRCREIGYVLAKDYWGRGLMPEAVREVLRYLFEEVKLDAVFCSHFDWNVQSARVQEKTGFTHYMSSTYETAAGGWEKDEINLLRREDWEKQWAEK